MPAVIRTRSFCIAAPMYVGDDWVHMQRPMPLVRRHGRQPSADIVAKYGDTGEVPQALTIKVARATD